MRAFYADYPLLAFLLSLVVGFPIWLVLYFGFFYWLEHLIKRGSEDPSVPVYKGPPEKRVVPVPPKWNFGDSAEFTKEAPKTARRIDYYRR